jgi:transposase-like protein
MSIKKRTRKKVRNKARNVPPFPFEFRLRVAQLHLKDGYQARLLAQEFNISEYSVYRWSKAYREQGEQGPIGTEGHWKKDTSARRWYGVKGENCIL